MAYGDLLTQTQLVAATNLDHDTPDVDARMVQLRTVITGQATLIGQGMQTN